MSSIFTKIIDREIPAYIIYEDEYTIAFLDINPIQEGHTIVVPKVEVDHLEDLEDEYYDAVMATVRKLALLMRDELQAERICLKVEGFEVPHAHVHLVPCDTEADFTAPREKASPEDLAEMAERLVY